MKPIRKFNQNGTKVKVPLMTPAQRAGLPCDDFGDPLPNGTKFNARRQIAANKKKAEIIMKEISAEHASVPDNIDELYKKAQQVKAEKCMAEINESLKRYGFNLAIRLQVGNQQVPLAQIVSLPGVVILEAK